ncbi:MAG: aminodeoxychorismate lyase [Rhodospirillaceae bacterium]|nr:MAG: aminodeoxychorismate lyase [Rhodospirillaceae bacterium]
MPRALKVLLVLVLIGIMAVVAAFFNLKSKAEQAGPHPVNTRVLIHAGSGLKSIAAVLQAQGVISNATQFGLWARLTGQHTKLQAGEFEIPAGASINDILTVLEHGETVVHKLTLAEGLTVTEMLIMIQDAKGLTGSVTNIPDDGMMLPETYHYSWGDDREVLVSRMVNAMSDLIVAQWQMRPKNFILETPEQLLTLASIVEKETGIASERPQVAAVFLNRLKKGMRLQSDPTVVFAITNGSGALGRALTRQDLKTQSDYNTYRVKGLPPGPIANPGRDSILAVMNPADIKALYFVADGTGGHVFAKTLKQHNRNVRNWRRFKRNQK